MVEPWPVTPVGAGSNPVFPERSCIYMHAERWATARKTKKLSEQKKHTSCMCINDPLHQIQYPVSQ